MTIHGCPHPANTLTTATYAYDALALLQRACSYVYDSLVLPYLAQTYATATTITVITGAFQRASTPTTATAHRKHSNSKSGKNRSNNAIYGRLSAVINLPYTLVFHTYDASTATYNQCPAPTPTTTDSTTVIHTISTTYSPAPPAETTPTTDTGVHYYGRRYYSPELGRWPSRDPIEEDGGLNVYGFVENDPVRLTDSVGLRPRSWTVQATTVEQLRRYLGVEIRRVGRSDAAYNDRKNQIWMGSLWWERGVGWITTGGRPRWGVLRDDEGNRLYNDLTAYSSVVAHELFSAVTEHFDGYGEKEGGTGIYSTGVHHLALVFEWGVWAAGRPDYLTCEEVKRRKVDADTNYRLSDPYSANQYYVDELSRLVQWICDCRCGKLNDQNSTFESLKYSRAKTPRFRRHERIEMQSKYTCKESTISGNLHVKLETR